MAKVKYNRNSFIQIGRGTKYYEYVRIIDACYLLHSSAAVKSFDGKDNNFDTDYVKLYVSVDKTHRCPTYGYAFVQFKVRSSIVGIMEVQVRVHITDDKQNLVRVNVVES